MQIVTVALHDLQVMIDRAADKVITAMSESKYSPGSPQPEADPLLTIQQAAELLCLSVPTMYGLVSRAEVPCMKKGKRLYFSKQSIIEWVKTGRKKTVAEAASEADSFLSANKRKGVSHA
jgi:excisionase family DNA binding protein